MVTALERTTRRNSMANLPHDIVARKFVSFEFKNEETRDFSC